MSCQYNPETFEEDVGAAYHKIKVQGLSHQVLQFEHTENWTASFDLAFDALSTDSGRGVSSDIMDARNFLSSLVVPVRGGTSVTSGAPTRVIFVWPDIATITCVVVSCKFKHKRFAWSGVSLASTWFVASMKVEEIRDTRLFADDVARSGALRMSR